MSVKVSEFNLQCDDAKLLVMELTESVDALYQLWYQHGLDTAEYDKITSEKRKKEYLGVRLAMRTLLNKDVLILYTSEGKPYLVNENYQISISHSNKWIAVMAHPTKLVGVDIECPTDKIKNIFTRFLSATEQKDLCNGNDIAQLQIAWSAKEALYKIIGKQAIDFANQLRIFPFDVNHNGQIKAQHIVTKTLYSLFYIQSAEYTLVYCIA